MSENAPGEEFISEPIVPSPGSFDARSMGRGEPGVPARFCWREREYAVISVLSTWKSSSPDRGELYLRRHWYAVEVSSGERMTLYCERQAGRGRSPKARWWLYTIRR